MSCLTRRALQLWNKLTSWHSRSHLVAITAPSAWYVHTCRWIIQRFCSACYVSFFFFKYWSWKLLKFALIQSAVLGLSHKDTISNDVYDGGMVFYKRLFLDNKLFTLHSSVFAIFSFFVPSKSTNSIFAMLESPWRFCTDQNFCNFDLFVAIYSKETTTKIIWI